MQYCYIIYNYSFGFWKVHEMCSIRGISWGNRKCTWHQHMYCFTTCLGNVQEISSKHFLDISWNTPCQEIPFFFQWFSPAYTKQQVSTRQCDRTWLDSSPQSTWELQPSTTVVTNEHTLILQMIRGLYPPHMYYVNILNIIVTSKH